MPVQTSTAADPLAAFSPATATWFAEVFAAPTAAQAGAWQAISSGQNALVIAPTGSGKTLAAFLSALDSLIKDPHPSVKQRCRVLYVSPLKALAVDVERTPTVISGTCSPSRSAVCRMPVSGARRLRSTSTASAFSGET